MTPREMAGRSICVALQGACIVLVVTVAMTALHVAVTGYFPKPVAAALRALQPAQDGGAT